MNFWKKNKRPKTTLEQYVDSLYAKLPWYLAIYTRVRSYLKLVVNTFFRKKAFTKEMDEWLATQSPELKEMFAEHLTKNKQGEIYDSFHSIQ